jgi:type IV pilus assembly protein PilX
MKAFMISRQRGVVLIISLIFLVLLTIIGVTAMQTTLLQERMAGNMRDLNLAFQATEASLRAGETWLPANRAAAEAATPLTDPANWNGTGGTSVAGFSPPLVSNPLYHVGPPEYVRIGIGLPPEYRYIYPVTGRGEGGTNTAVTIIQTMFE